MAPADKIANQIRLFKDRYKIEIPLGTIPLFFRGIRLSSARPYPFDRETKVIWYKTPKTAGSAIQTSLEDAGYLYMMKPGKRQITGVYSGRSKEFEQAYPEFWAQAYKFAIVRNPYDRFVSGWKYLRATQDRDVLDDFDLPPVELPWVNKGRHRDRDFMKHFTGEAHALFLARYGEDFDNFGYDR